MKARSKYMMSLMNRILKVRYESLELEKELCLRLLDAAVKENYIYGETFAYVYLVDCYLSQDDSLICGSYLRKAKELCLENGYGELLLPLYNFSGLYYLRMGDEQSALTYYLEGLDYARQQNNYSVEAMLFNNIGIGFQNRGDIASAKKYFKKAFEVFIPHLDEENGHSVVIYLCNLAEVSQILGELEDSKYFLEICESINTDGSYKNYRLCQGWCGHYAAGNDVEACLTYADIMLDHHLEELEDRYFASDTLITMFEHMLKINVSSYARLFLKSAERVLIRSNLETNYRLQQLKVRYFQKYGSHQEETACYKRYYEMVQERKHLNDKVRADGILSKLKLAEALEETELIYQENIRLEDASYVDEITGIYNRRYMNKQVLKAFGRSAGQNFGFIMLDIDYFKEYNDYYGHNRGDGVLRAVADCLRGYSEQRLVAARYGGDEFICLCIGMKDEEIEAYVCQVRNKLAKKNIEHMRSHCSEYVTLSIGYCNKPVNSPMEVDVLLELADRALYKAKKQGRNRYEFKDRMEQ